MDLRAMLNTDGGGGAGAGAGAGAGTGEAARGTATTTPGASGGISASSSSSRQPSQPPAPGPVSMPSPSITMNGLHGTPSSSSVAPVTPVQTGPPSNAFRNYSHSTHASPVMQHHDYPPSAGSYQSPTSYHPPPPAGPFGNRPHVPPIQPPGHGHSLGHDTRSPGSASMPAPSPSYRQTPPASSMNSGAQGYPFPPTSQPPPPASPSQRQPQYSSQAGYGPRDSYSSRQQSPVPPPIGMPTMPSRMPSQGSAASSSPYGQGPHPSQQQQQQAMPQTPPIGTPGGVSGSIAGGPGGAAYIQHQQHQRSLSLQSVPTPTSAHSQQPPFGPPYVQGSPVTMTHQALPPQQQQQQQHLDRHPSQRQSSQPPTPLGPPMSGPIRQSPATTYREPPSPYQQTQQQRTPSSATTATITNIPYPPQPQPMQTSPPPPAPATIQQQKQQILLQQQQHHQRIQQEQHQHQQLQRLSNSSYNAYDVAAASESHRRSMSQHSRSERERSISVSPKTRVPSLPSSSSSQDILHHPHSRPPALSQSHPQPPPPLQPQSLPQPAPVPTPTVPTMDSQRDVTTPAKRKLDDRNLSPDELQSNRRPPQPAAPLSGTNGNHVPSDSPNMPRPKHVKYSSPPTWAQTVKGRHLNASRNFSLKQYLKRAASGGKPVNGNAHPQDGGVPVKAEHTSRHASPETARSTHSTTINTTAPAVKAEDHPVVKTQVKAQGEPPADAGAAAPAPAVVAEPSDSKIFNGKYFPWEPSVDNQKPIDLFSKAIGDFIFFNVLSNRNLEEIRSRNVQFEIEAKLGIIIDKATNDRIVLPVRAGECVMSDEARIAFRSSMTESQHRVLNQWLNHQVRETHPNNPRAASRLEVKYEHRRETDRFFELPASQFIQHLPHCVAALLPSTSTLKARVTYHQQTEDVLAKIIKGRVADLNLHFPHLPLDCRVSVNLEWDWEGPAEEIIYGQIPNRERQPDRNKDRLSYTHGFYQVDLTQVTQGDPGKGGVGAHVRPMDKEHELEVELDANAILEHGNLLMTGQSNRFENLIDGFVDNIRVLARRCPPS